MWVGGFPGAKTTGPCTTSNTHDNENDNDNDNDNDDDNVYSASRHQVHATLMQ